MRKNFIWLLLLAASLFLLLSGCDTKQGETEPTTAVKEIVDSDGNRYSAIIGEDGFLMLGERTDLAITVDDGEGKPGQNSKGEYVTKTAKFPKTVTVDDEIHTKFFRLKIPENWKNVSDELVRIEYKKGELSAELFINQRFGFTVEECQEDLERLLSILGEIKTEDVTLSFAQAKKIILEGKINTYVFSVEGRTYFVDISADEKLFEEIDFEKIVNTIKFREGE